MSTIVTDAAVGARAKKLFARRLDAARAHITTFGIALALIALFARIMTYPLQHDEQFYVPAGVLFASDTLYPQLGFSHLPNLPLLLHLLFSLPIGAHYLLVARLLIFAAWCGLIGAVISLGRALGADRLAIVLMTVLLITNPLLLGPTGMAATNNLIAMPVALFGLLAFFKGCGSGNVRPALIGVSGLLLALAGGFKINYAVFPCLVGVAALFTPCGLPPRVHVSRVLLPLLIGGLVGAAPTLFFLIKDPQGLFYHTVAFHRGPQISFWMAHPDPVDPKIMSMGGKLLLAQQLWFSGATMVLLMTLACLVALHLTSARAEAAPGRATRWELWLIGLATALAALLCFPPTPAFPQYFTLPIPFALILVAALQARLGRDAKRSAQPVFLAAIAFAAILGAPPLLSSLSGAVSPRKWTGVQVHADAVQMARLVDASGSQAPVATLAPLYALEGGRTIYPQLALGPFIYRAVDYVGAPQRRNFISPISPVNIAERLMETCPAGILVGFEEDLDAPLAEFARRQHYSVHPLMLHAARQQPVLLMVEPRGSDGPCGSRRRAP